MFFPPVQFKPQTKIKSEKEELETEKANGAGTALSTMMLFRPRSALRAARLPRGFPVFSSAVGRELPASGWQLPCLPVGVRIGDLPWQVNRSKNQFPPLHIFLCSESVSCPGWIYRGKEDR